MKEELKKLFDSCAYLYDYHMESKGLYQAEKKIVEKIIPLLNNQRILDVGTGTGELAIYIAKNTNPNTKIVGIDISPKMVELADKKKEKNLI